MASKPVLTCIHILQALSSGQPHIRLESCRPVRRHVCWQAFRRRSHATPAAEACEAWLQVLSNVQWCSAKPACRLLPGNSIYCHQLAHEGSSNQPAAAKLLLPPLLLPLLHRPAGPDAMKVCTTKTDCVCAHSLQAAMCSPAGAFAWRS